ncbi:hypothetical protein [Gordonia sp. NPDC003376]
MVLGGALGAIVHASTTATATAETLIQVQPPLDNPQWTSDDAHIEVANEVAYLSGPGYHNAVDQRLAQHPGATITATQNGQSAVITLTTTADHADDALWAAGVALEVYTDHLRSQLTSQGEATIAAIRRVIDSELAVDPTRETFELRSQMAGVAVQVEAGPNVTVVQTPTVSSSGGGGGWTVAIALGAVAGGILGLGGALLWRNRRGIVTSTESLLGQGITVLQPEIDTASGDRDPITGAEIRAGRRLLDQLAPGPGGGIAVIGTGPDSGAGRIRTLLVAAIGPGTAIDATDIVEIGPLGDAPDVVGLVREYTTVAVVIRLHTDTQAALDAVLALDTPSAMQVVVTRHRRRWGRDRGTRPHADRTDAAVRFPEPIPASVAETHRRSR